MPWDIKEAIFSFFLITFVASIFAFYFGSLTLTGYFPGQDTNNAATLGINQGQVSTIKNQIADLNALQFNTSGTSQSSGTQLTTPNFFNDFVSGVAGAVCSLPLVSQACATAGATGVIVGLLQNTITWSWWFIDKIFDPTNASLSILGLAFKGIFALVQVLGIWWLLLYVISAVRGGK